MNEKRLEIRLFGGVDLKLDGQGIGDLPTRKAEALLAYLVCARRPIGREVLAELLWDDRPQDQALANLRSILSSLRRSLDDHLRVTRQTVAFNYDSNYWVDVAAFELLVKTSLQTADAHRQPAAANRQTWVAALQSAVDLYRGDFLEGFYLRESVGFEEWAILERERLQRIAIDLLWQAIDVSTVDGDDAARLHYVDKLLRFDNLSESAHRAKMLFLARAGQFNAALQHYDGLCKLLDDELGVEPSAATMALRGRIQAARSSALPPLPPPPPHFVGREEEEARLSGHLRDPNCRMVTVLGAGGMGKTRLAVETVRRLLAQHPGQFLHGVHFVPLAAVQTGRLGPTLAETLGIALTGADEPMDLVIDSLRDKEKLLVLDNFEQLVAEADDLARILNAAPDVKFLMTSQEPLHLQEEWIIDLAGLSTPCNDMGDAQMLTSFSAIQLFLQIAQRLSARYEPSSAEIEAIARICRLLEGMPLGIELAAVWIRQFSATQIADEIGRGLDFLTTSLRNLPDRHRSLRAAFDYAWRLLPPTSRQIFAQLATFQGGFTGQAAAAVAGAQPKDLALLVEKSLLRCEEGRYDMHPMLSRFVAEQLALDPVQRAGAYARHTQFFLDMVREVGGDYTLAQRQSVVSELPNVRAAWLWAAAEQNHSQLMQAASILHSVYSAQSWFRQGIDLFDEALAYLPVRADMPVALQRSRCELLGRRARMQIQIGQLDLANEALDEAMSYLHLIDDPVRRSTILGYRAMSAFHGGDMQFAAELTRQSLALDEASGDQDGVAFALNFLGIIHKALGEYASATAYFERAATIYADLGDGLGQAMSLNNLGNLAQAQGDYVTAHAHYMTCSRIFREQDHIHGAATTLANAGRLAQKLGNLAEAEALLNESRALKEEIHDKRGVAVALMGLADVALARKDHPGAGDLLAQGLTLAREVGDVKLMLDGLAGYAALHLQEIADPLPGARLLAFVLLQPALPQEIRDQVERLRGEIPAAVWRGAEGWAQTQSLSTIVDAILAHSQGPKQQG